MTTRIIIVEDEPLFLELLTVALSHHPSVEIVGSFQEGREALMATEHLQPQVAILDIHLRNNENGINLGLALRRQSPNLGIVLLSNHRDPEYLRALPDRHLPGWAYLLKPSVTSVDVLARAIEAASQQLLVMDRSVVKQLPLPKTQGVEQLTPRLQQILSLIAQGYSNSAIAQALHLAEKSIENHINTLYQVLAIDRSDTTLNPRVQAVRHYLKSTLDGG